MMVVDFLFLIGFLAVLSLLIFWDCWKKARNANH